VKDLDQKIVTLDSKRGTRLCYCYGIFFLFHFFKNKKKIFGAKGRSLNVK